MNKVDYHDIFLGEFFGTMMLIILGSGVVANVLYKKTHGSGGGLISIALGWGIAVFVGIIVANAFGTGGHLNPAVTISQLVGGSLGITRALVYFGSELLGAAVGSMVIVGFYWQHTKEDVNRDLILSTHSTGPTHKKTLNNIFSEFVGTTVLVTCATVLLVSFNKGVGKDNSSEAVKQIIGFAGPLSMGLVVFVIVISLGGTTGAAINPARDLMPRLVYQFTPYKNRRSANWSYAWIPVVGPLLAGVVVGAFSRLM